LVVKMDVERKKMGQQQRGGILSSQKKKFTGGWTVKGKSLHCDQGAGGGVCGQDSKGDLQLNLGGKPDGSYLRRKTSGVKQTKSHSNKLEPTLGGGEKREKTRKK